MPLNGHAINFVPLIAQRLSDSNREISPAGNETYSSWLGWHVYELSEKQYRVAPPTIPELALLQEQMHSERRRCGRRPSEATAAKFHRTQMEISN